MCELIDYSKFRNMRERKKVKSRLNSDSAYHTQFSVINYRKFYLLSRVGFKRKLSY